MVLACCASLFVASCHSEKEKEEDTKYWVTVPVRMDTTIVKNYVCQVQAIRHIELRTQERGYLEKIYVDEGQFVKKGQLLFQIMPIQAVNIILFLVLHQLQILVLLL